MIQAMEDVSVVPAPVFRDWSELPLDVLCFLFADKLGAVEVLMGAGLVCRSWLQAAKEPHVFRSVQMEYCNVGREVRFHGDLRAMAKAAADRSAGRLEVFAGDRFVTSELLLYIAERAPALKTVRLTDPCYCVTNQVFIEASKKKAPLVEPRWRCRRIGGFFSLSPTLINCQETKSLPMTEYGSYSDDPYESLLCADCFADSLASGYG